MDFSDRLSMKCSDKYYNIINFKDEKSGKKKILHKYYTINLQ